MPLCKRRTCCITNISLTFYILQGVAKYLKYGIALEVIRTILKNINQITANPVSSVITILSKVKLNIVSFLVGYVGIYKVNHHLFVAIFSHII